MTLCIICVAIGALLLAVYIPAKIKEYSTRVTMLKSLVSVMFIATAVAAEGVSGFGSFAGLLILGLLFGLLGDIWLDLKFVYPDEDTLYTYAGFCVFAVGHLLFIAALLLNFADFSKPMYIIAPVIISVIAGIVNVKLGPVMKLCFGKFKGISMLYGAILFSMTLISGSLAFMNGWQVTTLNLMFLGGISFLISDLVLSGTYFGGKERPVDIILNYITYYGAQFIIALSIAFI